MLSVQIHHVALYVRDMERSLHLFQDLLGFQMQWRLPSVGGRKLSALLGIPGIEAEIAYLQNQKNPVALELVRLVHPPSTAKSEGSTAPGQALISLSVRDLDGLYTNLEKDGWKPFTPAIAMPTPQGTMARICCFRTEEGMTIELIEE
jgi:catechol 2,3-dioxygenase-like lactoylglutathione lyase family enzyme